MGKRIEFSEELNEEGIGVRVEEEVGEPGGLTGLRRITISWSPGKAFTDNYIDVHDIYGDDPSALTIRVVIISEQDFDGEPVFVEWSVPVDKNFRAETTFSYKPKSGHTLQVSFGDHSMIVITLSLDKYLGGLPSRKEQGASQGPNKTRRSSPDRIELK